MELYYGLIGRSKFRLLKVVFRLANSLSQNELLQFIEFGARIRNRRRNEESAEGWGDVCRQIPKRGMPALAPSTAELAGAPETERHQESSIQLRTETKSNLRSDPATRAVARSGGVTTSLHGRATRPTT